MKKIFAFAGGVLAVLGVVAFAYFMPARAAEMPSCTMHIKSGWNMVSLGEFLCGMMEIESSSNQGATNFPVYLDVYGYDGREYVHGRIGRQDIQNGSLDRSFDATVENYFNGRIKNIAGGQYSMNDYFNDAENSITNKNLQKIKEYAGRLARESFVSVWVYNPGGEFTVTNYPRSDDDDETIMVLGINLLSGNISDSGYSLFKSSLEKLSVDALRDLQRQPGMLTFVRELFSGRVPLESGWNFLSYSKVLSDDAGRINLNSGNCTITKAYLFNDSTKNWVRLGDANASMVGSGVVVYNAGSACTLNVKNQYLDFVNNLLGGGSQTAPPQLPS